MSDSRRVWGVLGAIGAVLAVIVVALAAGGGEEPVSVPAEETAEQTAAENPSTSASEGERQGDRDPRPADAEKPGADDRNVSGHASSQGDDGPAPASQKSTDRAGKGSGDSSGGGGSFLGADIEVKRDGDTCTIELNGREAEVSCEVAEALEKARGN